MLLRRLLLVACLAASQAACAPVARAASTPEPTPTRLFLPLLMQYWFEPYSNEPPIPTREP